MASGGVDFFSSNDLGSIHTQFEAQKALFQKFDEWLAMADPLEQLPTAESSYRFFSEFTREYIAAFLDGTSGGLGGGPSSQLPDVRMIPMESIQVGDPIHTAALDFAIGQNKVFGHCKTWTKMGYGPIGKYTPYAALVDLSAARIVESGRV